MGTTVAVAVTLLGIVLLGVGAARMLGGGGGAAGRAGRATVEVESLFSPAKRHQVEQQEIIDTSRVDTPNGDGNPLDRYTDAAAMRRRWDGPRV